MRTPDALARLLVRRAAVAAQAPAVADVLRGTLRKRYVRCGKPSCHCRKGQGHGPFAYLSVALGTGRTAQITIAADDQPAARLLVRNYERLWQAIEAASAINRELLQRRLLPRSAQGGRGKRRRREPRG
jgi:hypothetical protein